MKTAPDDDPISTDLPNPRLAAARPKTRILITEDELVFALDLQRRLENMGYQVAGIAASGDDAIVQAQLHRPDLVLMDIVLSSEMDGIETAAHIREHFDLPVIYLTANADPTTLERAQATYPFSYLLKPLKDRELKFSIEMALYHHRITWQLRESQEELEARVQLRTAELTATNLALQKEIRQHLRTLEDLRSARAVANCASHAKTEFLATVSHELLTPMNGIIGMTEMLQETVSSDEQQEFLSILKLSADTLLGTITDVLDFARIESGNLAVIDAPFSLSEQLDAFLRPLQHRAARKNVALSWQVNADVPDRLISDSGRLGQILVNLVGNAIKFTERGTVEVRVDVLTRDERRVYLHFAVADTGIGIPEEKQKAIFQPFVQADNSAKRRYTGAGLGLSICSRLVELMGGTVWLESTVGAGSTFHVTMWMEATQP